MTLLLLQAMKKFVQRNWFFALCLTNWSRVSHHWRFYRFPIVVLFLSFLVKQFLLIKLDFMKKFVVQFGLYYVWNVIQSIDYDSLFSKLIALMTLLLSWGNQHIAQRNWFLRFALQTGQESLAIEDFYRFPIILLFLSLLVKHFSLIKKFWGGVFQFQSLWWKI